MIRCYVGAGYAEFALQASIAGSLTMVAALAGRVASLEKQHDGQPAVGKYALVGPAQTTIINSELAGRRSLRHGGHAEKKLR